MGFVVGVVLPVVLGILDARFPWPDATSEA
jgi:hypothetical protein